MINKDEFSDLSLNDLAEIVRLEGKQVVTKDFFSTSITLYFLEGEVIEVWSDIESDKVKKVERVWECTIDPFLKYLEISTVN